MELKNILGNNIFFSLRRWSVVVEVFIILTLSLLLRLGRGAKTGRNISSDKGSSFMKGRLAGVGSLIS